MNACLALGVVAASAPLTDPPTKGESPRSLCLVPGKRDNGVVATGTSGRYEGQSEMGFLSR